MQAGAVRVNGSIAQKRATIIVPGDVLTFAMGDDIRVIQIDGIGTRRGPAPEAQALYSDLSPPAPKSEKKPPENPAFEGKGVPASVIGVCLIFLGPAILNDVLC